MDKYCKAIELDKILARLAQLCSCEDAKAMALAIEPARDLRDVRELMQYTVDANTLTNRYSTPSVGAVENPAAALKRSEIGARLSPRELLDVGKVLRAFETIERWRRQLEGGQTSLSYLLDSVVALPDLQKHIADTIISEEEISDNASPELADIRRKIRQAGAKAREVLDKMVRSATYQKFLQDNIITQRDGRFVVPVKLEYRNEIKGLVHDTSSSGATVFIEPMGVVEANNEIRLLQGREQAEIDRILYELSAQVGGCAASIRGSYEAVVELDLYFAKSRLADEMHASVPAINDTGVVRLKKARHPLLDKHKVVPIDLSLGETFDTLVVTGPNTGGKTVAIKTLGLLTAMAQCGLMLPVADGSTVPVFKKLLVDIGDEQSIEQSLSTFSAHMTNIIRILDEADGDSLVLLDELRRHKDSDDFSERAAAAKVAFKANLRKLQDLADPVTRKNVENYVPDRPIKRGDTVRLLELGKEGTVLSAPDGQGYLNVQAGIIKTRVHQSEVRLVDMSNKRVTVNNAGVSSRGVSSKATRDVKTELDLRGMTSDEALVELERFIDSCVLSGVPTVTIIHGKGTGALRAAVQQRLRKHRNVKTFRLGTYGEGEAGVTIAELK